MKTIKLLGINFVDSDFKSIFEMLKNGAFMVVPSGPGLATIGKDLRYTESVQNSDFAIPDSGYMVFLAKLLKGKKIKKISGYKFLRLFFKENFNKWDLFLIDPSEEESKINNKYLNDIGIPIENSHQYIAPFYEKCEISDEQLLKKLNELRKKPKYILINLGSGVQEPLGYYLKKNLNYKTGIICTGAAISFFTGKQANISPLIDNLGLGWFWRCIKNPKIFIPRYLKAINLFILIIKSDLKIIK